MTEGVAARSFQEAIDRLRTEIASLERTPLGTVVGHRLAKARLELAIAEAELDAIDQTAVSPANP